MTRLRMSGAAAALFRALLQRAGVQRDRILLTGYLSVDWQSLTFIGERHEFRFRVPGPGAAAIVAAITSDLGVEEFDLPGQIVADIVVTPAPENAADGSVSFGIEALTIAD